jgi:hypothetical protein
MFKFELALWALACSDAYAHLLKKLYTQDAFHVGNHMQVGNSTINVEGMQIPSILLTMLSIHLSLQYEDGAFMNH